MVKKNSELDLQQIAIKNASIDAFMPIPNQRKANIREIKTQLFWLEIINTLVLEFISALHLFYYSTLSKISKSPNRSNNIYTFKSIF